MAAKALDSAHMSERPRLDRIDSRRRKIDWLYWPDTSAQNKHRHDCNTTEHAESISSRPDIEDEELITWGLAQNPTSGDAEATVDILYGEGTDLRKCQAVTNVRLHN
jgi:alpha-mannosidase